MKYLFPIIFLIFLPFISNAQFSKGLRQVGGVFTVFQDEIEAGYTGPDNFIRVAGTTESEIRVIPRLGIFLNERTSMGFGVGYARNYSSNTQVAINEQTFDFETTTSTVELEFFSRTHYPITENFSMFVQPGISGSFGNSSVGENSDVEFRVVGYGITVTPGMVFMINNRWGVEAAFGTVGYNRRTLTPTDQELQDQDAKTTDTSFGVDLSLRSFQLGIQYYFFARNKS